VANLSEEIQSKLSEIQHRQNTASAEQIIEVVRSVMASLEGQLSPLDLKIGHELDALAKFIQNARNELAALRPADINDHHIPVATDELSAVVGATEEATQKIMDCAEQIDKIAAKLQGEDQAQLQDIVTRIFEACSFQDITGQRINKVVKTLQHIEVKIDELLAVLGHDTQNVKQTKVKSDEILAKAKDGSIDEQSHLLNGPQMPQNASTQDEIDALLASFDNP
jgi:chemotaxis protein CheZ